VHFSHVTGIREPGCTADDPLHHDYNPSHSSPKRQRERNRSVKPRMQKSKLASDSDIFYSSCRASQCVNPLRPRSIPSTRGDSRVHGRFSSFIASVNGSCNDTNSRALRSAITPVRGVVFAPDCAASVGDRKASGKGSTTAAVRYVPLYSRPSFMSRRRESRYQSLLQSEPDAILHAAECFHRDSYRAVAELTPCSGGTFGAVRWHF